MADWYTVAKQDELKPGKTKEVFVEDIDIMLINLDGTLFAVENLCTHDGGSLSAGEVEGDEIICPRHGARFCVKTGEATTPPAYEDIESFPVRIENGEVQILVES